jgi:hypothetical protein
MHVIDSGSFNPLERMDADMESVEPDAKHQTKDDMEWIRRCPTGSGRQGVLRWGVRHAERPDKIEHCGR